MRKLLIFTFVSLAALTAWGQSDPRLGEPTVLIDGESTPTTSTPYAVIVSSVNETILFSITTTDGGTGTILIEGSLGDEAAVKGASADWATVFTTTQIGVLLYLEDPPPYIRVSVTPTSNSLDVAVRGPGTRFRAVQ